MLGIWELHHRIAFSTLSEKNSYLSGHSYRKASVLATMRTMETEASIAVHILENMPSFEHRYLTQVELIGGPPDTSEYSNIMRRCHYSVRYLLSAHVKYMSEIV